MVKVKQQLSQAAELAALRPSDAIDDDVLNSDNRIIGLPLAPAKAIICIPTAFFAIASAVAKSLQATRVTFRTTGGRLRHVAGLSLPAC